MKQNFIAAALVSRSSEAESQMRKIIYVLILANFILAVVVFLPKIFNGKSASNDFGLPQQQSGSISADHDLALKMQRTAKNRKLTQSDLDVIRDSIVKNQVKGDLKSHMHRGEFLNALLVASLFNNLDLNEAQKRQVVQMIKKDLDFIKSVSDDSATLNVLPVEARRSGFTNEKQQCLSLLAVIKAGKPSIPVVLSYVSDTDPQVRKTVGIVLKDAGYHVTPEK